MSAPATGGSASRSRSRSKRSSTNLGNLRLAPLSSKYTPTEGESHENRPKTPSEEAYARQHSSYLQGKSAPTTPGILSRSSSRRSFSGGLSRRDDQIQDDGDDEEAGYAYNRNAPVARRGSRPESDIAYAKSDAALLASGATTPGGPRHGHRRHASGHSSSGQRHKVQPRSKSGISTPRAPDQDDSWLARTGSRTSALLHEEKPQSWLTARDAGPPASSDDDDHGDDNYEEMAALSASTAKLERFASRGSAEGEATTPRKSRWGSRYGSRAASRATSRYGSPVGTRTPRPQGMSGYFDDHAASFSTTMTEMQERAFVDHPYPPEFGEDQAEIDRLSTQNSFGLGTVVDKLMNLRIFGSAGDGGETTDDEAGKETGDETETEDEAKERMAKEALRRKHEKEKLVALPPAPTESAGRDGQVGAWQDAAWLLSVASKAIF